jgi:uncharacterized protein YehS (DUF1456 family)
MEKKVFAQILGSFAEKLSNQLVKWYLKVEMEEEFHSCVTVGLRNSSSAPHHWNDRI